MPIESSVCHAAELPESRSSSIASASKWLSEVMMNKDDIMEILAIPLVGIVPDHEEVIVSGEQVHTLLYNEDSVVGVATVASPAGCGYSPRCLTSPSHGEPNSASKE